MHTRILNLEQEPIPQVEPEQEEQQKSETALVAPEREEIIEGEFTTVEEPPIIHRRVPSFLLFSFLALFSLTVGILGRMYLFPLLSSMNFTSLDQEQRHIRLRTTVTYPYTKNNALQITRSLSLTVPATGRAYQDATQAHGYITFYNAAPYSQTIDAGTLLIGQDGAQIVTNQTVTISAAAPPTEGQATVLAHAFFPGDAGNIYAGDIRGVCCKAYIFASNSAFSGGENTRDYTIVQKQDITIALATLTPQLSHLVRASLTSHLQKDERETIPVCSLQKLIDHQPGAEARSVTVSEAMTCETLLYNYSHLVQAATQLLTSQAHHRYGSQVHLTDVHFLAIHVQVQRSALLFTITASVTVIYPRKLQDVQPYLRMILRK